MIAFIKSVSNYFLLPKYCVTYLFVPEFRRQEDLNSEVSLATQATKYKNQKPGRKLLETLLANRARVILGCVSDVGLCKTKTKASQGGTHCTPTLKKQRQMDL